MRYTRFIAWSFFWAVWMANGALSFAQDASGVQTFVVVGSSEIQDKNIAKAKENAMLNGRISGVDAAVIATITQDMFASNFKEFSKLALSNYDSYIQSYQILAETSTNQRYRVLIQVTVNVDQIKEKFKTASQVREATVEKQMPRILMLVAERDIENTLPKYWWGKDSAAGQNIIETELTRLFTEKGFQIMDHSAGIPNTGQPTQYPPSLSNSNAVDIGLLMNADIVIVGNAVSYKTFDATGKSTQSFNGTVTLRVLRSDTGEEIASSIQTIAQENTDENAGNISVLKSVGAQSGEELAQKIADNWRKKETVSDAIRLVVSGNKFLSNFVQFRESLSTLPKVQKMQIEKMSPDNATLLVDYQGNGEDLAEALILRNFKAFGIQLHEVTKQQLKLELIPE